MPARAYWQGQIKLALVSIPVEIYPATKSGPAISFRQIHEPSGKPIHYDKVVSGIGPVDRDEQVEKPRGDRDSPVRGWLDGAERGHLCSGSMPSRSSPCTEAARPRTSAAALLVGARSITSCWCATASPKLSS